jgi:hypothetical protein
MNTGDCDEEVEDGSTPALEKFCGRFDAIGLGVP